MARTSFTNEYKLPGEATLTVGYAQNTCVFKIYNQKAPKAYSDISELNIRLHRLRCHQIYRRTSKKAAMWGKN